MIFKNWLTNTKTSNVFTIGGMEDLFITKKDLFNDYEDELEGGLLKTCNKIPNTVIKCKIMKLET
jgi:hypothetical protein